jgi:hypothetical protein
MAMSDNFLNNPTQTQSESQNKLLETLESICDLILATPIKNLALPQLSPLIEFSKQINLNVLETAILALVNSADPDYDEVTEKFLIKTLRHFINNKRSPIQQAIHNLVESKILMRERDSSTDIYVHPRFKKALSSGDLNTLQALQPKGIVPFLRNFLDHVLSTRHYHPFGMMTSPFESDPMALLNIQQNENLACVKYLKQNVQQLQIAEKMQVYKSDCVIYCRNAKNVQYDLIFADPPYHLGFHEELIQTIFEKQLLTPDGLVIIEHGKQHDFSTLPQFDACRNFGNVYFSFFKPTT